MPIDLEWIHDFIIGVIMEILININGVLFISKLSLQNLNCPNFRKKLGWRHVPTSLNNTNMCCPMGNTMVREEYT